MCYPGSDGAPGIIWFRLKKNLPAECDFEYSADENAQIFCDGEMIACGPEAGCPEYWYKQRVHLEVVPGEHTLSVRLLCFGKELTAHNQMSVRHGFYTTLDGDWECFRETDCRFFAPWPNWGVYPRIETGINFNFTAVNGDGGKWVTPEYFIDTRELHTGEVPSLLGAEEKNFHREGDLLKFDDYVTVIPTYRFSGKGSVEIRWGETGYLSSTFSRHTLKGEKGKRDGNFRVGEFDRYELPGGETVIADYQYRCGRYAEFRFTGDVQLSGCSFRTVGYPYKFYALPEKLPEKYRKIAEMAKRTLECCSHDTFIDCPYYERLMYLGDARMEALAAYAASGDSSLARKALRFFALSQRPDGAILARYPAKIPQIISSFIPVYVLMLHDCFEFTGDEKFIRELLPSAEKALKYLMASCKEDGLIYPEGWHFIDWQWPLRGVPFSFADDGTSSIINLLTALALQKLSDLERNVGNVETAAELAAACEKMVSAIKRCYYDKERGMIADDKAHLFYSEHAQVLMLQLKDDMPELLTALEHDEFKTVCGIYFSHYYLEVCRKYGCRKLFEARLEQWCELANFNLRTLPEEFSFPRSDCHAWGSHILYHLYEFYK